MDNDWQALLNSEISDFITAHRNDDVRDLALRKCPDPAWPYALILDQIKARQKAKVKIPSWCAMEGIVFPPSDTIEQASSDATSRYKAGLFQGDSFVDLTGGAGIDSFAVSEHFTRGIIVEQDAGVAAMISHNAGSLCRDVGVICDDAQNFVLTMDAVDLALIDPQRRNVGGGQSRKGLYKLEDCSPNIFDLLPHIKAKHVLLKTSPMLDIDKAIAQLGCVFAVHVVEWRGECKELLFVLTPGHTHDDVPITAVSLGDDGAPINMLRFTRAGEKNAAVGLSMPRRFLYEPSPAFMKAGAFKTICTDFDVTKLHAHTHLYTSEKPIIGFPGRGFFIEGSYPVQGKLLPVRKANLAVRNFPQDVHTLKKKLKIKDGGDDMLFACTLENGKYALIHCSKNV